MERQNSRDTHKKYYTLGLDQEILDQKTLKEALVKSWIKSYS